MQPSPILPPPASASQTPSKGIEQLSKTGCGENASYKFFFVLGLRGEQCVRRAYARVGSPAPSKATYVHA